MTERLIAATRTYRRAAKRADDTRAELYAAIYEAHRQGMPQKDICAATGYTREMVRQIVEAGKKADEESG